MDKIVDGYNLQAPKILAEPSRAVVVTCFQTLQELPRADQRDTRQILEGDGFFARQGIVLSHQHAANVGVREAKGVVTGDFRRLNQKGKIQETAVEPFCDVRGAPAVETETDGGMFATQRSDRADDQSHRLGLRPADAHLPGDLSAKNLEISLGLPDKREDFLGTAPQEGARRRQRNGLCVADEVALTKFILQVAQLTGEGWLCQVQAMGGPSDGAFPRDGRK